MHLKVKRTRNSDKCLVNRWQKFDGVGIEKCRIVKQEGKTIGWPKTSNTEKQLAGNTKMVAQR